MANIILKNFFISFYLIRLSHAWLPALDSPAGQANPDDWLRLVNDVRTYWQNTSERFFMPSLSLKLAEIN